MSTSGQIKLLILLVSSGVVLGEKSFRVDVQKRQGPYDPYQRFNLTKNVPINTFLSPDGIQDCNSPSAISIVRANITTNLTEHLKGLFYTSDLLFGSQSASGELIYDTGSGWLAVSGANCDTCINKTYDHSLSNTSYFNDDRNYTLSVSAIIL